MESVAFTKTSPEAPVPMPKDGNRSGGGQKNVHDEITRNQYENQSRFDLPQIIVSS